VGSFSFYFDVTKFSFPSWGACGGKYWKCLILCFVRSQLVRRKWKHHGQQPRSNAMSMWDFIWCTETR
jgi:hypothetical protein